MQSETFWDKLGRRGKRSIIINQPSTYPARPLNGVLISGFVAIDLAKAVFPASCRAPLEADGIPDRYRYPEGPGETTPFSGRSSQDHRGPPEGPEHFWEEDWDYFELVVTGTDRLHHFLWNAGENEHHADHAKFLEYYRQIDELIDRAAGAFRDLTGGDDGLFLLSDHGFSGIEQEVYLNAWLEREGFLNFGSRRTAGPGGCLAERARPSPWTPAGSTFTAGAGFPGVRWRIPRPGAVKAEIEGRLSRLEFGGRKVVRKVFRGAISIPGPFVSRGPDLIVLSEPGFDMKGSVKKKEVFGRTQSQGMHTWDDAFFWANRPAGQDLAIRDLSENHHEEFRLGHERSPPSPDTSRAAPGLRRIPAGRRPPRLPYIGPGAGFAFLSSFLVLFLTFFLALFSFLSWPFRFLYPPGPGHKVLKAPSSTSWSSSGWTAWRPLAEKYMAEGKLPNLARLESEGSTAVSGRRPRPSPPSPGPPS